MKKILWTDGIILTAQHFQLQDKLHEEHIAASFRLGSPIERGVLSFELDAAQLKNNLLSITSAELLFATGQVASLTSPVSQALDKTAAGSVLSLAISSKGAFLDQNFDISEHTLRYLYSNGPSDEETDTPIELIQPKVLLILDRESAGRKDEYLRVPLLKIKSVGAEGIVLDKQFIPEWVHIRAAGPLLQTFRTLHSRLSQLILRVQHEINHFDVANLKFIAKGSGFIAALHQQNARLFEAVSEGRVSTRQLYYQITGILGTLSLFGYWQEIHREPYRDNYSLSEVLSELDRALASINENQADTLESEIIDIKGNTFFLFRKGPLVKAKRLVLEIPAVGSDDMEAWLENVLLSEEDTIETLLRSSLPGLDLKLVDPNAVKIAFQGDSVYFEIDVTGERWKRFVATGSDLAVYFRTTEPERNRPRIFCLYD